MWDLKEYRFASSPAEAVALLRRGPGRGAYIAGGSGLRRDHPDCDFLVDINHAGIDLIDLHPDGDLFLGAAAPLQAAARDPAVEGFAEGAVATTLAGCVRAAMRPTATLGGQICHGGRCGEIAPLLLVLDAACVIADETATTTLPLCRFYRGEGANALADRLLVGVVLPAGARLRHCLEQRQVRDRGGPALAHAAVGMDVVENRIVNLRIALGEAVRSPQRAPLAEAVLTGLDPRAIGPAEVRECAETAAAEISPLDDRRATADYRRDLVCVLTRRLLSRVLAWQDDDDGDRLA